MIITDETSAKSIAESLLGHARSVYKYADNYCRDSEFNERFDDKTRATFKTHAVRLLKDLYAMVLLAKYNGINRYCNTEQIEAYYEAGREIVENEKAVVDYSGLLN